MNEQVKTTKELISLYLTILSSWLVYATCQSDYLLPALGLLIITFSLLKKVFSPKTLKNKTYKKLSWATILSLSLLLGWVWITLYPRNYPSDLIQSYAIFILQTSSIVLSLFLWFNPTYMYQVFFLKLLAWLTVALSVNVAFTPVSFSAFLIFCCLNTGLIVFTRDPGPTKQKSHHLSFIKQLSINFFFCLMTLCLFSLFVTIFKIGDAVYTRFIQDYAVMHNRHPFFAFNPVLNIQGPGISGADVRPVLEVDKNDSSSIYLLTQIFDKYEDGRWYAVENPHRAPVKDQLDPNRNMLQLRMLTQLKDVLPTPRGTDALTGYNGPYEQDVNGIVYTVHKDIHQVKFTVDPERHLENKGIDTARYTWLEESFKSRLKPYLSQITNQESDPFMIARKLQHFFRSNYAYSLNVQFRADDDGIIYLLEQAPSAYCSFFASAMAVLLRAADIPSRLVVGFLGTDTIGNKKDKFLVRVRDAHAWVEAYLPMEGNPEDRRWVRFDPTPYDERIFTLNNGRPINRIADRVWLAIVRFRSDFENLESEKLLFWLVIVLVLLVFVRNRTLIIRFMKFLITPRRQKNKIVPKMKPLEQTLIHKEFEQFLKRRFKTQQKLNETHRELILRLRVDFPAQQTTITKIDHFLKRYQEARFGGKQDVPLKQSFAEIKK